MWRHGVGELPSVQPFCERWQLQAEFQMVWVAGVPNSQALPPPITPHSIDPPSPSHPPAQAVAEQDIALSGQCGSNPNTCNTAHYQSAAAQACWALAMAPSTISLEAAHQEAAAGASHRRRVKVGGRHVWPACMHVVRDNTDEKPDSRVHTSAAAVCLAMHHTNSPPPCLPPRWPAQLTAGGAGTESCRPLPPAAARRGAGAAGRAPVHRPAGWWTGLKEVAVDRCVNVGDSNCANVRQ